MLQREYRHHFSERLGLLPQLFSRTSAGAIWLHAVSVGEVVSAVPLIAALRERLPAVPIYLSTSTVAGRKAAEREATALVSGVFYLPLDFVSFVRRSMKSIRPALVVVLETEIWPNLWAEAKRAGASLAVVNGRISGRAWPRYSRSRRFFRPVLQLPDAVFVQSEDDHQKFLQLGVSPRKLKTEANLKYDAACSKGPTDIPAFGASHVWIAASTVGPNERGSVQRHAIDEDDIVIAAFQSLLEEFPRLLLILAPRQPARFQEVAGKLDRARVSYVRRTALKDSASPLLALPGVLLLDTIGELAGAYALADVVFVGGSIAPRGGHNIIEPAAAGVPVVVGPHMQNFEVIAQDFISADAVVQIKREGELRGAIRSLLLDDDRRKQLGTRAHALVAARQGVSERLAEELGALYHHGQFRSPPHALLRPVLNGLACAWRTGGVLKRNRSLHLAASLPALPVPVVSIGGITVGGSGKTPFTTYLSTRLAERGYSPAILTRGYRRRSPAPHLILAPGAHVPAALTGDEAQIFLRTATSPVGIGTDRFQTARLLLNAFPETDVLVLDDGFQHARLKRDLDIVLIDGLDPFGSGKVAPLGRLREPLSCLRRASAFVVTRAESDGLYAAIRARLNEANPKAPVFRTRLIPRRWHDAVACKPFEELPTRKVAAFCGLGNPRSFWETLESLGLEVVFRWTFADHHSYKPIELRRLAHQAKVHGAGILVTTEKDQINCPVQFEQSIAPLKLAWLEIELQLEDEPGFFLFLEQTLQRRFAA